VVGLAGRKKRLTATAEWHFGGGGDYCRACPSECAECAYTLNKPQTLEGYQIWDLVLRAGGQLRAVPGAIIGWDMTAILEMGRCLGVSPIVMAELLPSIEAVAMRELKNRSESDG